MASNSKEPQVRAVLKNPTVEAYKQLMDATGISQISDAIAYMAKYIPFVIEKTDGQNIFSDPSQYEPTNRVQRISIEIDSSIPVEF